MRRVSHPIDRVEAMFDEPSLVADAGLIVPATLMVRLGLEALVNQTVRLVDRVGGSRPGRKVLTLVASILVGGSHIDHTDRLRAGATQRVLPFRVMAPSTLGTFLRAFTFGHVRQLDAVIAEAIRRASGPSARARRQRGDHRCGFDDLRGPWQPEAGCRVLLHAVLGYHPTVATRADTSEVLHARLRKGSSQRGAKRSVEELIARVRRAGAMGALTVRGDSGFWSYALIDTLARLGVRWSVTVNISKEIRARIDAIDDADWQPIAYPDGGQAQVGETTIAADKSKQLRAVRLVVRRTRLTDPAQQALWPDWRHHAFITDVELGVVEVDQFHRDHATVELAIRSLRGVNTGTWACPRRGGPWAGRRRRRRARRRRPASLPLG